MYKSISNVCYIENDKKTVTKNLSNFIESFDNNTNYYVEIQPDNCCLYFEYIEEYISINTNNNSDDDYYGLNAIKYHRLNYNNIYIAKDYGNIGINSIKAYISKELKDYNTSCFVHLYKAVYKNNKYYINNFIIFPLIYMSQKHVKIFIQYIANKYYSKYVCKFNFNIYEDNYIFMLPKIKRSFAINFIDKDYFVIESLSNILRENISFYNSQEYNILSFSSMNDIIITDYSLTSGSIFYKNVILYSMVNFICKDSKKYIYRKAEYITMEYIDGDKQLSIKYRRKPVNIYFVNAPLFLIVVIELLLILYLIIDKYK